MAYRHPKIRIYLTKHGARWECRAPNGEVTSRGGEPFKKGKSSLNALRKRVRRRITTARYNLVNASIDFEF